MKFFIVLLLSVFFFDFPTDPAQADEAALARIFKEQKNGVTFVLYDADEKEYTFYDRERAQKRFRPASTFKIPNTLIGLTTGAVKSVDEILPYPGGDGHSENWRRDMSLRQAITISNLPIYQVLAQRIGLARMKIEIDRLGYGNREIGQEVDKFWLDGPLAISAVEQCGFLADLARTLLPFPAEAQAAAREIILLDQGEGWKLFGKTGATFRADSKIGWWVGWVEKEGRIYSFALNMDLIDYNQDLPKRVQMGRAALCALGIISPCPDQAKP